MLKLIFNRISGPVDSNYFNSSKFSHFPRKIIENLKLRILFLAGYQNSAGLRLNIIYSIYHFVCRLLFKNKKEINPLAYKQYSEQGFLFLKESPFTISSLNKSQSFFNELLSSKLNRVEKRDFMTRYFLNSNDLSRVLEILTPEIEQTINSILRSNFMITSSYLYRVEKPLTHFEDTSTWLWHSDEHPDCHIKVFIFLNDVQTTSGATALFNWKYSKSLKINGFIDRRKVPLKVKDMLNNTKHIQYATGPRGTVLLFNANVVHKAVVPTEGYRDLLVFEVLPSPFSKKVFLNENFKFWQSPLEMIFSKAQDIQQ